MLDQKDVKFSRIWVFFYKVLQFAHMNWINQLKFSEMLAVAWTVNKKVYLQNKIYSEIVFLLNLRCTESLTVK